jgi:tetratricopeptide (TPR) repeat protein
MLPRFCVPAVLLFANAVWAQSNAAATVQELQEAFQSGLKAMDAKLYDNAIASFSRASTIDPKQAVVWAQLGRAYSSLADTKPSAEQPVLYEKAVDAYSRAIELKPAEPSYRSNYILALGAAGKFLEARASYAELIKLDPANTPVYSLNMGILLRRARMYRDAIEVLKAVPQSAPQYASARYLTSVATVAVYLDSAKTRFQDLRGTQTATDADIRKIAAEAGQPAPSVGAFTTWDAKLSVPGGACSVTDHRGGAAELECAFDEGSTVDQLRSSYQALFDMTNDALGPLPSGWTSTEVKNLPAGALQHVTENTTTQIDVEVYYRPYAAPSPPYRAEFKIVAK